MNSQTDAGTKIIFTLNVKREELRVEYGHSLTKGSRKSHQLVADERSLSKEPNIYDSVWPLVSSQFVSGGWRTSWRRMLKFSRSPMWGAHLHERVSCQARGIARLYTSTYEREEKGLFACACLYTAKIGTEEGYWRAGDGWKRKGKGTKQRRSREDLWNEGGHGLPMPLHKHPWWTCNVCCTRELMLIVGVRDYFARVSCYYFGIVLLIPQSPRYPILWLATGWKEFCYSWKGQRIHYRLRETLTIIWLFLLRFMDSNGNYFMVIRNEIRYALIFASFYVLLNLKDIRYFDRWQVINGMIEILLLIEKLGIIC